MMDWEFPLDSTSACSRVWFQRKKSKDCWMPLRKCDCESLNAAHGGTSVLIESCRATADLKTMTIKENFIDGPSRQLISAIWFERHYMSEENYDLVPVSTSEEKIIDDVYKRAMNAYSNISESDDSFYNIMKEEVPLGENSEYRLFMTRDGSKICMKKRRSSLVTLEVPIELQRGYHTYEVEGEKEETSLGEIGHLIFAIHGIGESMWNRDDVPITSWRDTLDKLRLTVNKKQYADWKQRNPYAPPPKRIEFIPVEWYDCIHSSASALKNSLLSSTIQSIPNLRAVANDVVFDVLMYMTPEFSEVVLSTVIEKICKSFERFTTVHACFSENNGLCSLIGHSLGSVIAWDILCLLQENDQSHETWKGEVDANSSILNVVQKYWNASFCEVGLLGSDSPSPENGKQSNTQLDVGASTARKGSWGPTLRTKISKSIPFVPHFTFFLGSPLGLFLSLRGVRVVFDNMRKEAESLGVQINDGTYGDVSPFCLPSKSIYNIFHPHDPVAYRIEPLLIPPETPNEYLPKPVFLIPKGKEMKLHLRAQEMVNTILSDFEDLMSKIPLISSDEPKRMTFAYKFALGGKSDRVDYQLQPKALENEYLSAISAHTSYLQNDDVIDFIIQCTDVI